MIQNYILVAIRNLKRQKIFSLVNIVGLALSLTAIWLITLFVADELSFDRYNTQAGRLYRLVSHGNWDAEKFDVTGTSGKLAPALQAEFPEVERIARIDLEGGGILSRGETRLKDDGIFFTDPSFFSLFTHHFLAGTAQALQKPNTIVITRSLAAKLFTDPLSAMNQTIMIDNKPTQVTGIIDDVPHNSHMSFDALRPLPENYEDDWGSLSIYTYILLRNNADAKAFAAKLPAFIEKNFKQQGGKIHYNLEVQPVTSIHLHSHLGYELGENRDVKYIYVLSAVGFLIFLIAFINYVNITTARASVRLREVAVRKVIGSSRTSLVGLFLTESIITILLAAVISVLLASLALPLFNSLTAKSLSIWYFGISKTLCMLLLFSVMASVIGGLYPALFLSRFKAVPALKNQMGDVKGQELFRRSLVVFQFVITVVMITASLVIYLQLTYVKNKDLGFVKNGMLTFHLDDRSVREKTASFRSALLQSPLVTSVATAGNPIGNNNIGMMDYSVEKNGVMDTHSNLAYGLTIDEDFIPTMRIPIREGRNFSLQIASDSNNVIVNEAFVKKQGWKNGLGKKISRGVNAKGDVVYATIIGVISDYHIYSLQHKIEPMIMMMPQRAKDRDNMYVRISEKNIPQTLHFIEQTFRKFDVASPFEYHFLDANFAAQYVAEEKQGKVLLVFTALTICIACLGLFGLITFTVNQRIKEIGIRKVLGASTGNMVALLTRSLLQVVTIAMLIAIPISWLIAGRWLQDFAYRIDLQWWMFACGGLIAFLIAMATLSIQSVKAALANPVNSLRNE